MTASDGSVGGVTKIVDGGPDNSRWNLVVLGDGYQASELGKYHSDVQSFVEQLRATPPYGELWSAINIHRIDVTSTESGADDPACAGGSGATARTYFDSTFCSAWGPTRLDRLLTVDSKLARSVAIAKVPETHQVLVFVNSAKYGGSGDKGRQVAVCSTEASASQIAIHEIGHSAHMLADEYEIGGTVAGAAEPLEPNITLDTNPATNKWGDLIAATTPMPTSSYADCAGHPESAVPTLAGAVGAYEGGGYFHCGMYRPSPACYMRDYSPFCEVCARVIRETLEPFRPDSSEEQSMDFQPDAITKDVGTAAAVTFAGWFGPKSGEGSYYFFTEPWFEERLELRPDDILYRLDGSLRSDGRSIIWVKRDAVIAKTRFARAIEFARIEAGEAGPTAPTGPGGPGGPGGPAPPPGRYPKY